MSRTLTCFFDGGIRTRMEIGAAGAVVYDGADEIAARGNFLIGPHLTVNVCEYQGLLLAMRLARELGATEVEIFGDSELVVRQVAGQYRVNHRHLKLLRDQCWQDASAFDSFVIRECPKGRKGKRRDNNQRADFLCGEAMRLRRDVVLSPEGVLL